jgi:integrase
MTLPKMRVVFGPRLASALTTADISRYMMARREKGMANATINREVEILSRALRLGVESRRILRMPVFPKKLRERNARQGFFELEDFRKVLEHLREPIGDMARFAFETGWRRGMLIGMKWGDVDRSGRTVTLPDSKNDDPQTMPLEGELWAVIERRWEARTFAGAFGVPSVSEYVFHRRGKPIPTSTFDTQFREACEQAGVVGRIFHDFRRTAARNMGSRRHPAIDRAARHWPPFRFDVTALRHHVRRGQGRCSPEGSRVRAESASDWAERDSLPE